MHLLYALITDMRTAHAVSGTRCGALGARWSILHICKREKEEREREGGMNN